VQRRTRNRICIWLIIGGLANFLVYTVVYAYLGGDARNGTKEKITSTTGEVEDVFYISGHFLHGAEDGRRTAVSRGVWIYSYVHSISIWPTQGVMMICMLILAQPHIIATMQESNWLRGPAFVAVAITLVAVVYSAMSIWFAIGFIRDLAA
jgi:hypothetical protein